MAICALRLVRVEGPAVKGEVAGEDLGWALGVGHDDAGESAGRNGERGVGVDENGALLKEVVRI